MAELQAGTGIGSPAGAGSGIGRAFWLRARQVLKTGPEALQAIPDPEEASAMSPQQRHELLEALRIELYAVCSIVADAALRRAIDARQAFPPYGLVRSLFTDFGVISANPEPVKEGAVDSFRALGKAYIDTMVFHLDAQLKQIRHSEQKPLIKRLDELVALFRISAGSAGKRRMRDTFSFMYGGLQFGASACVQLTEVMSRVLAGYPSLSAEKKTEVVKRSIRPAYQLAAVNVEDIATAYAKLQAPADGEGAEPATAGWMDPRKFVVQESEGQPWRILLSDEPSLLEPGKKVEDVPRYSTQGCPARISPTGGRSAIGLMWNWCAHLAGETGLFSPKKAE